MLDLPGSDACQFHLQTGGPGQVTWPLLSSIRRGYKTLTGGNSESLENIIKINHGNFIKFIL